MVGANGLSRQASSITRRSARSPDCGDHLLQRHSLGFGSLVHGQFGIDRHQIVDAADLKTVAGIIHNGPIGFFGVTGESAQRFEELVAGEIVGERHGLKAAISLASRGGLSSGWTFL
jgi:hypothetical protein